MNEFERLQHQHQIDQQWQDLVDRLKQVWGASFEHKAYYARRVLDGGGAPHLQRLAGLPVSAMLQIAEAYARVGEGQSRLTPREAHVAAELLADRSSPYYEKGEDAELHAGARGLVADLFEDAAAWRDPADPTEPAPPAGAEPSPAAKAEARKLMDTKGPYFDKAHPDHEAVRARVQGLFEGTIAPQAPAQTTPQTPAVEGQTGGEDHA
jgi:hypothetical protein